MARLARYRKLIAAIVGAVLSVLLQVYGNHNVWLLAVTTAATALGVHLAPNAGQEGPKGAPDSR